MAKKKKKAKASKATYQKNRDPNPEIWALPRFSALLDDDDCMTCSGVKIMVENQRNINTILYESLETVIETVLKSQSSEKRKDKRNPLREALAQVKKVPGSGPPECNTGGPGS